MATAVGKPSSLAVAAVACVALAAISLLLPSGLTYDPYQWMIWGRELAHLQLDTTGSGTSWKPLTALVAALLAPLGRAQPDAWLVIARAGGLFAAFMAFRLAARLAGGGRWAWPAGFAAAATLVFTNHVVRQTAVGNVEALTTGLVLLAVERHLDGRRGHAFALGVGAGLMRPESWPFLLAYGVWLWRAAERPPRRWLAAGAALVAVLWFGGDWVGSGRLWTGSDRALQPVAGTPGASSHPLRAVLSEAWLMLPLPARMVLPAAVAVVLADLWRRRRGERGASHAAPVLRRPDTAAASAAVRSVPDGAAASATVAAASATVAAALTAIALAWIAVVALMAQRGYAGVPRFMFPAVGLLSVVVGVGIARAGALLSQPAPRPVRTAAPLAALLAFALLVAPEAGRLRADATRLDTVADQDSGLATVVHQVGGAQRVFACGRPTTGWWAVTALAYDLGIHPARIYDAPSGRRPVVFMLARGTSGLMAPLPHRQMRVVDRVEGWKVLGRCAVRSGAQPVLRAAAARRA